MTVAQMQEMVKEFTIPVMEAQNRKAPPITFLVQMIDDEMKELFEAKTVIGKIDAYIDITYYILDYSIRANLTLSDIILLEYRTQNWDVDIAPLIFAHLHLMEYPYSSDSEIANYLSYILAVLKQNALVLSVELDPYFEIVHKANMRKFVNGKPLLREDGKVLKPDGWQPPEPEMESYYNKLNFKLQG